MVRWEIWKYLLEYIASYVCSGGVTHWYIVPMVHIVTRLWNRMLILG